VNDVISCGKSAGKLAGQVPLVLLGANLGDLGKGAVVMVATVLEDPVDAGVDSVVLGANVPFEMAFRI